MPSPSDVVVTLTVEQARWAAVHAARANDWGVMRAIADAMEAAGEKFDPLKAYEEQSAGRRELARRALNRQAQ